MDKNDKQKFLEKLKEIAASVGRRVTPHEIESYYKHLKSLPLGIVLKAMERALDNKNPHDTFGMRSVPTVPEIKHETRELYRNLPNDKKKNCEKCNDTGFVLEERPNAQPLAKYCNCFQSLAKDYK